MNILFPQNCVERLIDTNSPSLDTIKMQVHFDMNYSSRGNSYMCIQAKGGSLHMSKHISTFAIRVREGTIMLLSLPLFLLQMISSKNIIASLTLDCNQ